VTHQQALRRSVGFAFVTDQWPAKVDNQPDNLADAVREIVAGGVHREDASPRRTTVYAALLGTVRGPVVLYRTHPEAPETAADFESNLDEFIDLVDHRELSEWDGAWLQELGDIDGLGDLIDRPFGDRPDWLDAFIDELPNGDLRPRSAEHDQGRPVVQGSGRTKRGSPSDARDLLPSHGADDLKDAWGIDAHGPRKRVGPDAGEGLQFDVGALGWAMDGAAEPLVKASEGLAVAAAAAGTAAAGFALIAILAPAPPAAKAGAAVGAGAAMEAAGVLAVVSGVLGVLSAVAVVVERHIDAAKKKTPNPEDAGTSNVHVHDPTLRPHLVGEVVFGPSAGDRHRPRVRVATEWDGGTSYGWVHFGAPRAQPFVMPGDDAMPSDSSDETPNIWLGAFNAGTGDSSDDYWIVSRGDWAWSRFGAPRARSARNG